MHSKMFNTEVKQKINEDMALKDESSELSEIYSIENFNKMMKEIKTMKNQQNDLLQKLADKKII